MVKDSHSADGSKRFSEKFEVAGDNLVNTVKGLMKDASVRRIIIRSSAGKQLLNIPMTLGLGGAAVAIFMAPIISALVAIGGALAKVKIEVIREG